MTSPLSTAIQPFVDRHEIAGAVMFVADRDGLLAAEAVGWADIEARKPMMPGTSFWIASQTKPVTAVAVIMLAEEGKLSLDAPIETYLPEFAGLRYIVHKGDKGDKDDKELLLRKPSRPVTVKDLLMHTSGMPFSTLVEYPSLDLLPLATAVRSYAMAPLEFDPGATCLYSNSAFNTAGRIVEVLSGQSYESFLDQRLFRPLGMHDTSFWPDAEQTGHLAQLYTADTAQNRLVKTQIGQLHYPLTDTARRFPMPAGGLFSTARDVVIFYRMMLNDGVLDGRRYLSPESVRQMTTRHTPGDWERAQSLGFMADGKYFGHGGACGTNTKVDLASGLILGWLIQQDGTLGQGGTAIETFEKTAIAAYGKAKQRVD